MIFRIKIQIVKYFRCLLFKSLVKLLHSLTESFNIKNSQISAYFRNIIHSAVCSRLNNRKHNLTKYQYSIVLKLSD